MKFIYTSILCVGLSFLGCSPVDADATTGSEKTDQADPQGRNRHTEIYDNGQIKIDGWKKNGKRDGLWVSYYENGVKWSEDMFIDGYKDGKSITYYPNGLMRYRGNFIKDVKAGKWQFYDETGTLVKEMDFNK